MRFILLATCLIGFSSANLKPVLRHKKDVMLENQKPDTAEQCEQTFNALDQDRSGVISLEDVEIVSQNLSQVKKAELTDALSQMLYGTGVTSIQDDFSLSHADYMYFCMNADDMEAAIAKRVEWKKKAKKEKRENVASMNEKLAVANKNNVDSLQASCRMACPPDHYCGSGECRPYGTCATQNDCLISENVFAVPYCIGMIECNAGECGMNCGSSPPAEPVPSCYAACGPGEYCGSGGCRPQGTCGTVDDCFIGDNVFAVPMIACDGLYYCSQGQCSFQCNDWVMNTVRNSKEKNQNNNSKKKLNSKLQDDDEATSCQTYFQAMDTDNDGNLTYTEFTTFLGEIGVAGADYDEMVLEFGTSDVTYTEGKFCN